MSLPNKLTADQLGRLIYEIRGQRVMLDSDLAPIYGVETKALNRAVKRNADRFPEDFMFQIASREWQNLKCQIGILDRTRQTSKILPHVFTEHRVTPFRKRERKLTKRAKKHGELFENRSLLISFSSVES